MVIYSNELYHYGIKRRSGRYPYGSGDRPFQGKNEKITPEEKAQRLAQRKETVKKIAKAAAITGGYALFLIGDSYISYFLGEAAGMRNMELESWLNNGTDVSLGSTSELLKRMEKQNMLTDSIFKDEKYLKKKLY